MEFKQIKERLKDFRIGIAGAGGLGSNCAMALVRSGITKLIIADFDSVDESNLNRQFYFHDQIGQLKVEALRSNLLRINPFLDISIIPKKLTPENLTECFREVDILIEAFDRADQKEMLIETALSEWPHRPIIAGLGMAVFGHSHSLKVRSSGNLYICGDEKTEISPDNPPIAPRVGIVANMQANIVLEILLLKYQK